MSAPTLTDFLALNQQLTALLQVGVPLELGIAGPVAEWPAALKKMNVAIARRVEHGTALAEALRDEPTVTPRYRALVESGLEQNNLDIALARAQQDAHSRSEERKLIRLSLAYPLVVATLGYLGLVAFCVWLTPALEAMQSTPEHPHTSVAVLSWLRATLPYWVALPPIALLLVLFWLRGLQRGNSRFGANWWPGISSFRFIECCGQFSAALAQQIEEGTSLLASLRLLATQWNDTTLEAETRTLADSLERGAMLHEHSPLVRRLPPFFRWALCQSQSSVGQTAALRMSAALYQSRTNTQRQRWRYVTPLIASLALAGIITLLYGLVLFVPVTQMLNDLAR